MENVVEKYFDKLASHRGIFSNLDIDVRLEALTSYEMML